MAIQALGSLATGTLQAPSASGAPAADGFGASLGRLVAGTEAAGAQANEAVGRMLDGSGDVHDAMIAMQRADLTLQLTVQIRNKLVSAYQEIMRMPV
jgi:flagellar hook-basal body complex protein FliE